MYITYRDYQNLGYSVIPESEFSRYANMSEKVARRFMAGYTINAINITDENKRGLCEIADLFYAEQNQINRPLAGFGNDNYREQYFEGLHLSLPEQVWNIVRIYFTREQLYRGV